MFFAGLMCLVVGPPSERACRQQKPQLLEKPIKLALFILAQRGHNRLELSRVGSKDLFYYPFPLPGQFKDPGTPVVRGLFSGQGAFAFQAINRCCHRTGGQQHLGLNLSDRQGTLCSKASRAPKSLRHNPAFAMLRSTRWLIARQHLDASAGFRHSCVSQVCRPRDRKRTIHRKCARASDYEKRRDGKRQQMKLEVDRQNHCRFEYSKLRIVQTT